MLYFDWPFILNTAIGVATGGIILAVLYLIFSITGIID